MCAPSASRRCSLYIGNMEDVLATSVVGRTDQVSPTKQSTLSRLISHLSSEEPTRRPKDEQFSDPAPDAYFVDTEISGDITADMMFCPSKTLTKKEMAYVFQFFKMNHETDGVPDRPRTVVTHSDVPTTTTTRRVRLPLPPTKPIYMPDWWYTCRAPAKLSSGSTRVRRIPEQWSGRVFELSRPALANSPSALVRGLRNNRGGVNRNVCYANSALQCLGAIKGVREFFSDCSFCRLSLYVPPNDLLRYRHYQWYSRNSSIAACNEGPLRGSFEWIRKANN